MLNSRLPSEIDRIKSRVVLDKRFIFTQELQVEDKGQLLVRLRLDSERIRTDEDSNDKKIFTFVIIGAEEIDERNARII